MRGHFSVTKNIKVEKRTWQIRIAHVQNNNSTRESWASSFSIMGYSLTGHRIV